MRVTSVGIVSNVATVVGTIFQGNIPAIGNQISIRGTQSNSGLFNVTAATIVSFSGTPSTGVYSITFALTNANIGTTADSGLAIIPIAEVPEVAANEPAWPCMFRRTNCAISDKSPSRLRPHFLACLPQRRSHSTRLSITIRKPLRQNGLRWEL